MEPPTLTCSNCNNPVPDTLLNPESDRFQPCPVCNSPLRILAFPALVRKLEPGEVGEQILVEGEASCFYHPTKRAKLHCDDCGRFLCPVCDIDFNGRHICPACLEGDKTKPGKQAGLENNRVLFDSMALSIVLLTTLFFCLWPFWIISGVVAIVLGILSWSRPSSLIPRTRTRALAAILLGLLQIGGAIAIFSISFSQR